VVANGPKITASFTFLCPRTAQGVWTPRPVALMGDAFIFFKQNVSGNEDLSINGCTIL